ncbi:MAG: hypothetical protein L3K14_00395 [Thermoplasmata archaeon]|nr:hypothetical protein [Thermoplasmata archaeon]
MRVSLVLASTVLLYLGGLTIGAEAMPRTSAVAVGSIAVGGSPSPIGPAFWGLNVNPTIHFGAADVANLEKTPVTYVRYPAGLYAEEYNYTSGVMTKGDGTSFLALNPIGSFIGYCKQMGCKMILGLPLEINSSSTAAYYVTYVEHTLGYVPAYWELGNSPGSYTHFNISWSHWSTTQNSRVQPTQFALILKTFIAAVRAIDSSTPILGFGGGEVRPNGDAAWVIPMMQSDGPELAGVSVHSYAALPSPPNANLRDFFSLIGGPLGLPKQVAAHRLYVTQGCANCSTPVFVTEDAPTYVSGPFYQFDAGFPGALFEAAQVTQALALGLPNVDWFEYESNFAGDWIYPPGAALSSVYTLFSQLLPTLGSIYVPTSIDGPITNVYAAVTAGPRGSSVLVVNTNTEGTLTLDFGGMGIRPGGQLSEVYWASGSSPQAATFSSPSSFPMGPLSVAVFSGLSAGVEGTIGIGASTPQPGFTAQYLSAIGAISILFGAATSAFVPGLGRYLGAGVSGTGAILLWLALIS